MQAFVPKNRKPKFDLTLSIIDLTNIPLVVGHVSVKWHLPSSSSAEHRGRTERAKITEHRATWEYSKNIPLRMTIDKTNTLQSCEIFLEILQEYNDGGRGGRVHLGNVKLNLAEYANVQESTLDEQMEGTPGMITRRYLMQESKVNATLKVGIVMKQIDGETNYTAPPLRSAMVMGGIAGIIAGGETGSTEDMPSMTQKSRELSEAQDIYRRTLAASWACERGEMAPDKLIEDLFAGGDGGKMNVSPVARRLGFHLRTTSRDDSSTSSDADSRRDGTGAMLRPDTALRSSPRGRGAHSPSNSQQIVTSGVSGRGSIEQQMQHSQSSHRGAHQSSRRKIQRDQREVTEFDVRDDLRSWQIQPV